MENAIIVYHAGQKTPLIVEGDQLTADDLLAAGISSVGHSVSKNGNPVSLPVTVTGGDKIFLSKKVEGGR